MVVVVLQLHAKGAARHRVVLVPAHLHELAVVHLVDHGAGVGAVMGTPTEEGFACRRTGGTTPSLAKVFLPDPLAQALNSPVAIGGNAHVTRHNSDHHSDSDPARRHSDLGPQPGLGLRSVRHRRPDPDYPLDLAAAREDLAES